MSLNYKIYILCSSDKPEDIRYVGYTKGEIEKRLYFHKKSIKYEKTYKSHWIKKTLESGNEIVVFLIESGLTEADAKKKEIEYIYKYKKDGYNLTNGTLGGDGLSNPTQETIEKIRRTKTGIPSKLKGKKLEDIVGKERATIMNIENSKRQKGKKLTKEHKEKIKNNSAKFWLGKNISIEHNQKLQEGYQNAKIKNPDINKTRVENSKKTINQLDTNGNFLKEWSSIQLASDMLSINRSNIGECCTNKRKNAGGFKWEYKNNNLKKI